MKELEELFIETNKYSLFLRDGVLYNIYKDNLYITPGIAKEITRNRIKYFGEVFRPSFVDIRKGKGIHKEARDFWSSQEGCKYVSHTAVLIKNHFQKFIVKAFITINKPTVPTEIFTNQEKALEWIRNYKMN
ncbi:MAG: hypothetical protein ACK4ND_08080 [Cytophagaceae bacterium]